MCLIYPNSRLIRGVFPNSGLIRAVLPASMQGLLETTDAHLEQARQSLTAEVRKS